MEKYTSPGIISSVIISKDKYNLKPTYQRGTVWGAERKQALIDTIFRGYDMPKFYLERLDKSHEQDFNVIDGQQRLSTIFEFYQNKFCIGQISEDLFEGDLVGKFYRDLDAEKQNIFNSFQLDMLQIVDADESEIRDLFQRLQEGMPLMPAEKRNSMLGNMADFIRETAVNHPVFPKVFMSDSRMQKHDLAAIVMCLELYDGQTDVSSKDLKKMYLEEKSFDKSSKTATKIKKILNLIHQILSFQDIPEMNIKWGFVDLYWALSRLNETFKIKDHEEAFGNFYAKFEQERRAVGDDPTTLLSTGSEWDQDLYYYLDPFQREGAKRDNIKKRHEIYIRRIHFDIPELALLDEKRFFTRDERIAIWRRDDQACKSCHKKITFEEMEADHIFAWSKGGITSLSNAQSLCSDCNKSKGNSS